MKTKCLLALGVLLVGVTADASLTAAQKPAPPQPTEQQKLKERVDALDSQLKEAQTRADRAAFEKERIDKIQQHYEDYYEKVHNTEMHVLEAITATFALFVGFAALFGFSVFDQRIKDAVSKATTDLETKFDQKLAQERANLEKSNAAQMKQVEDDIMLRSSYAFELNQGQIQEGGPPEQYTEALARYRNAVHEYKRGKPRQLFAKEIGPQALQMTFSRIKKLNPTNFQEVAKNELANELYDDLEEELAQAALQLEWLAPLVKDRKPGAPASRPSTQAAPSGTPPEKAHSGTAPAPPNKPTNK